MTNEEIENAITECEAGEARQAKLAKAAEGAQANATEQRAKFKAKPEPTAYLAAVCAEQIAENAAEELAVFERETFGQLKARREKALELRAGRQTAEVWIRGGAAFRTRSDEQPSRSERHKPNRPLTQLELDAEQRLAAQGRSMFGPGVR